MFAGHPPMQMCDAMSRSPMSSRAIPDVASPAKRPRSDADPSEAPVSNSDIGRRVTRPIRPVPVCRVTSSLGDAEPVRMNWPGRDRSSHSRRIRFHR